MGRAPCCDKANVKRGPWSPDEDATLKAYIGTHGTGGNWMALPVKAGLRRCGKSCRLRWLNYLRPNIKHGGFTEEDDNVILTLHSQIGSRWSVIASRLPGRTDNDVKNYWNTKLKKKLGNILSFDTTKSEKLDHVGSKPKSLPCSSEAEIHSFVNVSASQNQNPSSFGLSAYNFHSLSLDPIQTYCPGIHMDVSEFSTSASTSRNSSSTRSNIVSILSDQESSCNISNSSATFGLDRSVSLAGDYDQLVYGSGVVMDFTGFGSSPYNSNNPDNYRICFQDKDGEVYPTPCYQNMGDFAFADIRPAQAHVLEPSVRDKY